ncbi:hypothetical protein GOBAR_AA22468 [Gossypium barbadense]|uniref:Uncharacterized protein n=1 Tax=Gossypium barbadense TaxID=3634 RepID=A0A2P5X4C7_GOSBA|nr:hypothetical protein GOBAR_AA22468 [Gossypium barbadense]
MKSPAFARRVRKERKWESFSENRRAVEPRIGPQGVYVGGQRCGGYHFGATRQESRASGVGLTDEARGWQKTGTAH